MPDNAPLPQGYGQPGGERMPLPARETMTPAQRAAAQALVDGPRKGVFGPFLPLLRSPVLLERVGKVGEYLRFESGLDARVRELATCAVARHVSNQFEWMMHAPLASRPAAASCKASGKARGPSAGCCNSSAEVTGPAICPSAKAAVMRPTSRAACAGARARISCTPASVMTMKVPPTSKADKAMVVAFSQMLGSRTPMPISSWLAAQTLMRPTCRASQPATMVDTAAVAPNTGQARPNQRGSSTTVRASAGRKVAGRM